MKRALVLAVALMALASACGGSGSSSKSTDTPAGVVTTVTKGEANTSTDGSSNGKPDCVALKAAASDVIMSTQYIAQLKTPDDFTQLAQKGTVTPGQIKFDVDGFGEHLATLHQLDSFDKPPFGSPKAAIDKYQAAVDQVKKLVAKGTPTQAEVDEFQSNAVGPLSDWVNKQSAISAALSETCH